MNAADTLINKIELQIINPAVTLLALIAFVIFLWGMVDYVRNAANEEKRSAGQQHMIWGIVGLVLIFGAIAIVRILQNFVHVFG